MKISIITFHFVNNFGGILQTYALQKYLKKLDIEKVDILDYRNWFIRFTDTVRLFPVTRNRKAFVSGMKTWPQRFVRKTKFRNFTNNNVCLSKRYRTSLGLKMNPPEYDGYICGSDQIWNPIITGGVNPAYYLDFISDERKKCSYAPSFGTQNISAIFLKRMKKYVSKIPHLSVREHQGAEMVKEWLGKVPAELIDPTFLLDCEEWSEVASFDRKLPEHYMLIYIMQSNYDVYNYAKKIKEETGLEVVDISRYGYNPGFVDVTLIDVGPAEFLYLFEHADIVCTNSYHGLVFSLIFKKKLFLLPSKNFASRILNLLDLLCIDKTDICDANTVKELRYDSDNVDQMISIKRKESLHFLSEYLEGLKQC